MNPRVLVVEDDDDAREALRALLSDRGYEMDVAANGDSAVAKAAGFEPDVLLCDWKLPGTRDGIGVAREVQRERDIPVIFFTASSLADLRSRTKDLNVIAYLPKPLDLNRLTAALATLN